MEGRGDITLAIETSNPSAPGAPGVCIGELVGLGTPALRAGDVLGSPVLPAGSLGVGFGGVHVLSTARILVESPDGPKQRNEDRMMLAVDEAIKAAGLTPRHVKRIAVSIGPGGFTSVRLAVVTAKCIAEVTGAACVGVPTALVGAVRFAAGQFAAGGLSGRGAFGVALASKGDDAYVQAFAPCDAPPGVVALNEGNVLDAAGLSVLAREHAITTLLADGFLPEAMRAQAAALNIAIAPVELDPVACLAASRGIAPVDPVALLPIYPREPEAVTKWRALHGEKGHGEKGTGPTGPGERRKN